MRTWQMYPHPHQGSERLKDPNRRLRHLVLNRNVHLHHFLKEVHPFLARHLVDDEVTRGSAVICHLGVWKAMVERPAAIDTRRALLALEVGFHQRSNKDLIQLHQAGRLVLTVQRTECQLRRDLILGKVRSMKDQKRNRRIAIQPIENCHRGSRASEMTREIEISTRFQRIRHFDTIRRRRDVYRALCILQLCITPLRYIFIAHFNPTTEFG